jgi:hypothetical protein
LAKSSAILHRKVQEPLVYRTPADFATLLDHCRQTQERATVISLIEPGRACYRISPDRWIALNLRLHTTLNIGGSVASGAAGGSSLQ